MRKPFWLVSGALLALVVSACSANDGADTTAGKPITTTTEATPSTTADKPITTTTAQFDDGYPWILDQKTPSNGGTIPQALDGLKYVNGETHQVQCIGCGAPSDNEVIFSGRGTEMCDHPVAYVPNQLIAQGELTDAIDTLSEDDQFSADDITPALLVDPESTEPYILPDEFRLYQIGIDPIDAMVMLGDDVVASPNYIFLVAPSWKFSPADQPLDVLPGGLMSSTKFEGGSVIVVDDFSSGSGHGQFVNSIVQQLTGGSLPGIDVQLTDKNTGQPWDQPSDTLSVSAAIHSAAEKADVINLSMGTYPCVIYGDSGEDDMEFPPVLIDTEIEGLFETDIVVVAAAGNDNHVDGDPVFYPAGFDKVVSVGALGWSPTTSEWYAADFSNMNAVEVWAPGVAIVGQIGNDVVAWSGTSFATPHYAACLASGNC